MRSKVEASRMSSCRRYVCLCLMIAMAASVSASDELRHGGSGDSGDGDRGVTLVGGLSSQPSVPLLIKREDQYHAKPSQHVPTDYSFIQTRPHVKHAPQQSKNYHPDIYMLEPDTQNNIYPTDTQQPKDKINIAPLPTNNKDIYSLETENENPNYLQIKERPHHLFDNFRLSGNLFPMLHAYHPYLQDEEIDGLKFVTSSLGNIRNVLGIESELQRDEQRQLQRLKETNHHDFLLKRKRRQTNLKRHRRAAKERQQQRVHSRSIPSDGGYYYNNPYSDQSLPAQWQQQVQQRRQQNSWQQNYPPQYQYPSNDVLDLKCWINNNQNNYNRLQPVWIPVLAVPQSHFPFYVPQVPQYYPQQPNTPRPDVNVPNTENRFGNDGDDRPIWDVVDEPATTRRPQSNRPQSNRPQTNRPSSRPPPPPPLIHNSEKQNTPPNQSNRPEGNRRPSSNDSPVDNTITQNVDSPPRCVWAIVACCTPMSTTVRYNCFEQLGCTGAFWDVSPCSTPFAKAAIKRAQDFYNQQEDLAG